MTSSASSVPVLADVLLLAYSKGFFPMANEDTGAIEWHRPDPRGIIPLQSVRFARFLLKTVKKQVYNVTINTAFSEVIAGCANRNETWISQEIIDAYTQLHSMGYAYSFEAWNEGRLAGGLYGVAIGRAFFGESMFSVQRDASKVAFYHLVHYLREHGFMLLDTQYVNDFTLSLGAIEIPDSVYQRILQTSLKPSSDSADEGCTYC